jgi:hypothetical protein
MWSGGGAFTIVEMVLWPPFGGWPSVKFLMTRSISRMPGIATTGQTDGLGNARQ